MDSSDRNLVLAGLLVLAVLAPVNYVTNTPGKLLATVFGISAFVYGGMKLRQQFDVPFFFIRREGPNYWGGAYGGLIGGFAGLYGATRNFETTTFIEFSADIGLIAVYVALASLLLMGTVLQDIEDGYLEIEASES